MVKKAKKKVARKTTARKTKAVARTKTRPGVKLWTKEEVALLRKLYRTTSSTEIAKKLKRTVGSVRAKALMLKLKKAAVRRKAAPKKKTTARRKPTARRKTTAKRKTARRKK